MIKSASMLIKRLYKNTNMGLLFKPLTKHNLRVAMHGKPCSGRLLHKAKIRYVVKVRISIQWLIIQGL
jgi:hypothetical protein